MYGIQPGSKRLMNFSDDGPDAWNSGEELSNSGDGCNEPKRKRRSRWNTDNDEKIIIPGMPTVLPPNLTETQQRLYVVHLQIEDITRKLRSGDLGIPANPEQRSPSPEPIYNHEGKRMNTREYRTRKKLEEDRHKLIQEALKLNPEFKPPSDYKPPIIRVNDKVMIPQEEHPEINFVGLLIGPRGNTLKNLEKDTGAKIIIRGKGSVKDGKIGRKDGQPLPGEDEPLHAYVTANNPENVKKAVEKIKDIIKQGIEVPEGENDLRKQQLRELALLNGTLRENDGLMKLRQIAESQTIVTNTIVCTICGGAGHIAQDCKQKRPGDSFRMQQIHTPADRAKMDSEYMSLMAELGEGPPPPPPKSESSNFAPINYGRTLLSNPPPNPMAINSPWQLNNRPSMGSAPLLNMPPVGMQQGPPQINPMGRLPVPPYMSQPQTVQYPLPGPPGFMPPSSSPATTANPLQPPPNMVGLGSMLQPNYGSVLRPWQQVGPVPQPQNVMTSTSGSSAHGLGPPPPPPSVLAPPPPPSGGSIGQVQVATSQWLPQPSSNMNVPVQKPATLQQPPPLQQQQQASTGVTSWPQQPVTATTSWPQQPVTATTSWPQPSSMGVSPWQQQPSGPVPAPWQQPMASLTSGLSQPASTSVQHFASYAPPPPVSYPSQQRMMMGNGVGMLMSAPPPPPPP